MPERTPVSELISRQQMLSDRAEKKAQILESQLPQKRMESLDPWENPNRIMRLGQAVPWLQKSLDSVNTRLAQITEEISQRRDELAVKAQSYQTELEQRRAQLARMQSIPAIPPKIITQFNERLGQFEALKETDPELKIALQFLQQKRTRVDVDEEVTGKDGGKRYFTGGIEVFPEVQPSASTTQPEEKVEQPLLVSPIPYVYDKEAQTLQVTDEPIVHLDKRGQLLVGHLSDHLGQSVPRTDLRQILQKANYNLQFAPILIRIEERLGLKLGQRLFIRTGIARTGTGWALGISPAEAEPQTTQVKRYQIEEIVDRVPWKEKSNLPKITINLETKEISIDGKTKKVRGNVAYSVLIYLAQNSGKDIPYTEIAEAAKNAGAKESQHLAGSAIDSVRKMLGIENAKDQRILASLDRRNHNVYRLNADVEIIGQLPQTPNVIPAEISDEQVKQAAKFPHIPVYEQKIAALNAFIDNPDIMLSEIVSILGPSRKTGRSLTVPQAFWSLKVQGGTNLLYIRVRDDIANQAEKALWIKVKQFSGQEDDRNAFELFNNRLDEWYKSRRTITPAQVAQIEAMEQLEVQEPTTEEAAIFGELLFIRKGTAFQFDKTSVTLEIEQDVVDAIKALIEQLPIQPQENLDQVIENYIKRRPQVLTKFRDLVRSEKFEEILDGVQDENIKSLLMWVYYQDREEMGQVFLNLLAEKPDFVMQYEGQELRKVWQEWRINKTESATKATPEAVSYVEPSTQARVSNIEKRDPQVYERINTLIDEVEQAQITEPLSVGKLTHLFNRLKADWLKRIEEDKHYVSPQRKNGHPLFTVDEITLMLYVKDFGNGLNSRDVRTLKDILFKELAKRQQK